MLSRSTRQASTSRPKERQIVERDEQHQREKPPGRSGTPIPVPPAAAASGGPLRSRRRPGARRRAAGLATG